MRRVTSSARVVARDHRVTATREPATDVVQKMRRPRMVPRRRVGEAGRSSRRVQMIDVDARDSTQTRRGPSSEGLTCTAVRLLATTATRPFNC